MKYVLNLFCLKRWGGPLGTQRQAPMCWACRVPPVGGTVYV